MTVLLAATAAALFGIGTYLVLQRKLSRVIIGIGLMTHGGNVLLITSGRRGRSPIIGPHDAADLADPLPQALALTAIVISFGVTALLLALAYRSWLLTADDEIRDDVDDRTVGRGRVSHDTEVLDAAAVVVEDPDDEPEVLTAVEPEEEPGVLAPTDPDDPSGPPRPDRADTDLDGVDDVDDPGTSS